MEVVEERKRFLSTKLELNKLFFFFFFFPKLDRAKKVHLYSILGQMLWHVN